METDFLQQMHYCDGLGFPLPSKAFFHCSCRSPWCQRDSLIDIFWTLKGWNQCHNWRQEDRIWEERDKTRESIFCLALTTSNVLDWSLWSRVSHLAFLASSRSHLHWNIKKWNSLLSSSSSTTVITHLSGVICLSPTFPFYPINDHILCLYNL